jgi:hypothetical protein
MKMLPKMISVRVNSQDVRQGIRSNATNCPLAFALKRELKGVVSGSSLAVRVGMQVSILEAGAEQYSNYKLESDMLAWIERFDQGKPIKPIQTQLRRLKDD